MADGSNMGGFEMAAYDCSILQFEGWDGAMAKFEVVLNRILGEPLPNKVGDTARHDDRLVIRIAPRRFWLLCDGPPPVIDVDAEFGCTLPLDEGRIRLRLSGRGLKQVLERCVAADWETLGDGRAIQTGLDHMPVLLLRRSGFECDLLVPRSLSKGLMDWIADASASDRYLTPSNGST
ncbi:MAG: sarcosine oxidase subunit gamma [Mesorhizobium sp.]|uniref:sarcosine oxidase subunit gamma n=2 Tax=Mesorhizobium TaxID=68287 RepID=UPI000FC9D500|nr:MULTISPECIES: sarcosine oxidase subunit gamma [unclassified Mesorhizobium]RUW03098.1 sarcosine oxidase subunit gamma [Mesorhizobium sp. M1A.F.Ca.IN.020.04.1.1]RUW16254.1 sarcosine oxidase subunit gamma [Mesorhizobium sp. M1A.F.Ca.IN.020.03.1.1]RWF75893.1 MAG: sarcosine oxidase subunit gamma [Mesorhizobium sp.]RWG17246.1 MAG: sarcosine oxidase subunit gamma [Mesorhizobium sp.]RWG31781.1 MAG: sarcosine oxidase subunit gamma [Mesorhizobium sp.]